MPQLVSRTSRTVDVDGDSPRWAGLNRDRFAYCNATVTPADLPVKPGKRRVTCELLEFDADPSIDEITDYVRQNQIAQPCRAAIETLIDEADNTVPLMGICGVRRPNGEIACIDLDITKMQRNLACVYHWRRWYKTTRIVVVIGEEPLP